MHLRSPRSTPLGRIAVVAATLWWGCADTGGVGPRPPRMASFALSRGPDVVMQQASGRPTVVTHVRIRLRDDTLLVADTVAAFPRTAASLTVQVVVGLAARTRSLRATVEYLGASEVLLQTAGVVTARSADEPAVGDTLPPPVLPPGTPVPDVIEVFPRDTILFQGDSMLPRVTAIRGGATLSTVTYVQVSAASDVLVEPASGWVHVPARRGAAWVRVRIPGTTLRDSVLVRFQPRPSGLVIASGGNQSATAGTTLAQPLVARVIASDGQPVAGVAVSFAAPVAPGAAVATPVAISDSTGLVRTQATVSTVAAAQAFTATAAGVAPLAFPAMSLPGAPAQIIADAGATTTATASSPVAVRPMVRVRDTHGNSVPDASIVFRRANVARGTIADSALATDAQGLAMLGTWVAGPEVGEDTVLAAVVSPSGRPAGYRVARVARRAGARCLRERRSRTVRHVLGLGRDPDAHRCHDQRERIGQCRALDAAERIRQPDRDGNGRRRVAGGLHRDDRGGGADVRATLERGSALGHHRGAARRDRGNLARRHEPAAGGSHAATAAQKPAERIDRRRRLGRHDQRRGYGDIRGPLAAGSGTRGGHAGPRG